ncbi:MAG: hypothetical protein RBU45_24925 [Myxococcota bacterium]|jgi:hypothetical protein|nr:hypothetical protein [Myxococcota bacterium]
MRSTDFVCQAPLCDDLEQNGLETDVDCGGNCNQCDNGKKCISHPDCLSKQCVGGLCRVPTCNDGVQNGTETGEDCGGPCLPAKKCADLLGCQTGADCQSGVCTEFICLVPSCDDEVKNGSETDIDCGGPCAPCGDGEGCSAASA